MVFGLYFSKAKPNPRGKDRGVGGLIEQRLAAEWVDVTNGTNVPINIGGYEVNHKKYHPNGTYDWEAVVLFPAHWLRPGQTIRVHSGKSVDVSLLPPEDRDGALYHTFTEQNRFIWNNREGDCPALWLPSEMKWIDSAEYDPYPPDGEILTRVGNKLEPRGRSYGIR